MEEDENYISFTEETWRRLNAYIYALEWQACEGDVARESYVAIMRDKLDLANLLDEPASPYQAGGE